MDTISGRMVVRNRGEEVWCFPSKAMKLMIAKDTTSLLSFIQAIAKLIGTKDRTSLLCTNLAIEVWRIMSSGRQCAGFFWIPAPSTPSACMNESKIFFF